MFCKQQREINTFVVFVLGVKDSKALKLFGGFRISGQAGILTSRRNTVNQILGKRGLSVCEIEGKKNKKKKKKKKSAPTSSVRSR
jgi:hypothetical protein